MLTLNTPAKINLTLEILSKRQDGYHEISSVIQAVSLCDTLHFRLNDNIEFECDSTEWIAGESLIPKAANLLKQITGYTCGVSIGVEKRIPMMAGLGGDSSDAAAVLKGLNQLWETGLTNEELGELAQQLGSDVTFFLSGGTALMEGRGEVITSLPPVPEMWVIIIIPSVPRMPGKTGRLYSSIKANHYTDGSITRKMVEKIERGTGFSTNLLFNTFENVAFVRYSELNKYRSHIKKTGARNIHLAGSGPALYMVIYDRSEANDLFQRLKQQNMECYLVKTAGTP